MDVCQSCGMPLTDAERGTEKDGSLSADYCKYCYQNGAFPADCTMEQMIEICVDVMRKQMQEQFPTLKRWKKA